MLTQTDATDLFRSAPHQFLEVGAGEVAYRRVGSGPDVLLVPGWPVSGATYRKVLPHLSDAATCHVIDLPGSGDSRWRATDAITVQQHVATVRRVPDLLALDDVAVVGQDSGGLIARHALAGDPRVRAFGLVDTEHPDPSWRFRTFLAARHLPGFGAALGWVAGKPKVRRNGFVFGDAFADRSLLDGEFDEFFLAPLRRSPAHRAAAQQLIRSFDFELIRQLPEIHRRIDVPVQLVWGAEDVFFPVEQARRMTATFPNAHLTVIEGAGLLAHEERPAEVAAALLPTLTR